MRSIGAGVAVTAAIVIAAVNLRPALITVGPLLPAIAHTLALNTPAIATVSALPIVVLGAVSPFAYRFSALAGLSGTMLGAQVAIALGILLRSSGTVAGLIAGSVLLATGIGLGNALLPALIKLRFPNAVGRLMGIYTMSLTIGAATGAAITPLLVQRAGGDWRSALAWWAIPATLAAILWIPMARTRERARSAAPGASPWHSRTGWFVSLFMGVQSAYFYSLVAWLGVLFQARGMSLVEAGVNLTFFYIVQIGGAFLGPVVIVRAKHQGVAIAVTMLVCLAATTACLFAPATIVWLAAAIVGLCLGAIFGCALTFMVVRARDASTSARLSGMSQCVGYLLAGLGPLLIGLIHTSGAVLIGSEIVLCAIGLLIMVFGFLAGRPRFVEDDVPLAA